MQSDGEEDFSEISFEEMLEEVRFNIKRLVDEHKALITCNFSAVLIYFSKKT